MRAVALPPHLLREYARAGNGAAVSFASALATGRGIENLMAAGRLYEAFVCAGVHGRLDLVRRMPSPGAAEAWPASMVEAIAGAREDVFRALVGADPGLLERVIFGGAGDAREADVPGFPRFGRAELAHVALMRFVGGARSAHAAEKALDLALERPEYAPGLARRHALFRRVFWRRLLPEHRYRLPSLPGLDATMRRRFLRPGQDAFEHFAAGPEFEKFLEAYACEISHILTMGAGGLFADDAAFRYLALCRDRLLRPAAALPNANERVLARKLELLTPGAPGAQVRGGRPHAGEEYSPVYEGLGPSSLCLHYYPSPAHLIAPDDEIRDQADEKRRYVSVHRVFGFYEAHGLFGFGRHLSARVSRFLRPFPAERVGPDAGGAPGDERQGRPEEADPNDRVDLGSPFLAALDATDVERFDLTAAQWRAILDGVRRRSFLAPRELDAILERASRKLEAKFPRLAQQVRGFLA